jgi:hypothetical protein
MRILDLRCRDSATATQMDPKRKATFTSNPLAYDQSHPVALFFIGTISRCHVRREVHS